MPYPMTTTVTASIGSDSYVERFTDEGESLLQSSPSVPAAKTGTLTTRTDDNTGTFTMTTGHGFITSDEISVFWSTGSRTRMTATVTGDSVVLDGGSGDVLPSAATAITAMKPVEYALAFTGNFGIALAVYSPVSGFVTFKSEDPQYLTYQLAAGEGQSWSDASGEVSPLDGEVWASVFFSHADSTQARTMRAAVIVDE